MDTGNRHLYDVHVATDISSIVATDAEFWKTKCREYVLYRRFVNNYMHYYLIDEIMNTISIVNDDNNENNTNRQTIYSVKL
jgi:hypothetical protein